MADSPEQGKNEENTFIKAFEDLEQSQSPIRGPEAFPLLEIIEGPKIGSWFTVAHQKEITLGRAATNSIILEDNSVSRSHAVLQSKGDNIFSLRDIGSRNGTFLNGNKVGGEIPLNHQDIIKLGIYSLKYLEEPVEEPAVPPIVADEALAGDETVVETTEAKLEAPPLEVEGPEAEQGAVHEGLIGPAIQDKLPRALRQLPLRNLGILLLAVAVFGGGGYLASRLGAFQKLKTYFTAEKTPQDKPEDTNGKAPKPKIIKPQELPVGKMVPIFLEAAAQPVAGKIFYKGKEIGETPFKISLQVPVGKPQELSAEFFLPEIKEKIFLKKTFTVNQKDEAIEVEFVPLLAALKIKALAKDGELYLEGKYSDQIKSVKLSQVSFEDPIFLPFGDYVAEVRVPEALSGGQTKVKAIKYRREFSLNAQQKEFVIEAGDKALAGFPAKITSDPSGAELYVDGKKRGSTPFDGVLPTGRHELLLKKEGFDDFKKELTIELNTPYIANFNLKTSPAGEYINRGRALLKRGLYNQAIEKLAEALKRNPEPTELSQIHILLGQAFIQSKTYDQALAYYQKASQSVEYAIQGKLGMAEAYFGLGQKDQAMIRIIDVIMNTKDKRLKSKAKTLFAKLSPMKSVLYIVSQPPGAQVTLNDNPMNQVTPVILSDLILGTYRVGIQKSGYKKFESRVTLPGSVVKPVIVKLEEE